MENEANYNGGVISRKRRDFFNRRKHSQEEEDKREQIFNVLCNSKHDVEPSQRRRSNARLIEVM